jgi:hypothetical protein
MPKGFKDVPDSSRRVILTLHSPKSTGIFRAVLSQAAHLLQPWIFAVTLFA